MPRTKRLINKGEKTAYHFMSRTALDGFPFGDVEKDELVKIIKKFSKLFFVDVFGYCVMSNHFHVLAQVFPGHDFTDEEIRERCRVHYGEKFDLSGEQVDYYREKLSNPSNYLKEIKQSFSWYYNKRHNRRGTLWGERFKSVIVEKGETLINCLAYIDLNPLRAGIVNRPEEYRWNSVGYHMQTKNKDDFLSFDFGLSEFGKADEKEKFTRYRKYLYEAGALERPGQNQSKVIDDKVIKKERKKEYKISRVERFRYRTRYFTDSGVIGSKAFVSMHYQQFKGLFQSKNEKQPKPVQGIEGMYSLKRLAER